MKHILCLLLLTVPWTMFAGDSDSSGDAKLIQGKWKPTIAILAGQPMDESVMQIISLKMEKGKYEVFVGNEPDRGTYVLDPNAQPKAMTITGVEGPNRSKVFPAIYELTNDTLRICYDLSGAKRPSEFRSVAGTKLYSVTYKRMKP
jgi:uncharacterized protein (TIGR03067 family)